MQQMNRTQKLLQNRVSNELGGWMYILIWVWRLSPCVWRWRSPKGLVTSCLGRTALKNPDWPQFPAPPWCRFSCSGWFWATFWRWIHLPPLEVGSQGHAYGQRDGCRGLQRRLFPIRKGMGVLGWEELSHDWIEKNISPISPSVGGRSPYVPA